MKKLISFFAFLSLTASLMAYPAETFNVPGGHVLTVTMIHHGSVAFDYDGFQIQVDPVMSQGKSTFDYSSFPKADVILITHEHGDHLQPEAVSFMSKESTRIVANGASAEKLGGSEVIANGESCSLSEHITLTAVPAYNYTEGRENFHPKGNGNGYILDFDGFKVYVSGDTEDIEELGQLPDNLQLAFLSANQPYTMTVEQCIRAAGIIKAKEVIPYHLSQTDMQAIKTGIENLGSGIKVSLYEELR